MSAFTVLASFGLQDRLALCTDVAFTRQTIFKTAWSAGARCHDNVVDCMVSNDVKA